MKENKDSRKFIDAVMKKDNKNAKSLLKQVLRKKVRDRVNRINGEE